MGLIAYVFPVLLLVGTFFAVSNRGNRVATVKLVAMILFDLFLCMLIELLTKGSAVDGAAAAYSYSFEHQMCIRDSGYTYRSEVTGILKGLGFSESEFDRQMSELSGGQKTRVSLCLLYTSRCV